MSSSPTKRRFPVDNTAPLGAELATDNRQQKGVGEKTYGFSGEGRVLPAVRGSEQCRDREHNQACGADDLPTSTSRDGCGDLLDESLSDQ